MGFMWSSPKSPLKESLLKENAIEPIQTADLLLIGDYTEDMCIGDFSPWSGVAIVFDSNRVYDGAGVYNLYDYIENWSEIKIRYYVGVRNYGFDIRLRNAIKRTCYQIQQMSEHDIENGYGVAHVLKMLGIVTKKDLYKVYAGYFSSGSPFCTYLKLDSYYSENKKFCQ